MNTSLAASVVDVFPFTAATRDPNVAIMQTQVSNMAPMIENGDLVEVDLRYTRYAGELIYVFTFGSDPVPYVGRLTRFPDGELHVLYDNEVCPGFTVSKTDEAGMKIHGRVVKIWSGRKP